MSKVTDIHTALIARTVAVLNGAYCRLPNPHQPEENPEPFLKLGYGVVFGPENNTQLMSDCQGSYDLTLILVLTRKLRALENKGAAKADQQLLLLEDVQLMKADIETDPTLNDQGINNTFYVGHNGIEYVQGPDKEGFIMVRMQLRAQYFEHLST